MAHTGLEVNVDGKHLNRRLRFHKGSVMRMDHDLMKKGDVVCRFSHTLLKMCLTSTLVTGRYI